MHKHTKPTVRYDTKRLAEDMAARGWMATDLARAAGVSHATIARFFTGFRRTAKTAGKMAQALGYTAERYVVRSSEKGRAA